MLLDLLCTDNYVSYNIKLAHLFGLNTSIYLTELMNINTKAIAKNKMTEDFFTVDRAYITSRTTIDTTEQKLIEEQLFELGVLKKSDSQDNTMSIDITLLTSMMLSTDEKLIEKIKKITVKKKKTDTTTKRQTQADALKRFIVCNNDELREAYEGWIDGVYANPKGFLSKKSIEIFQKAIDEFSQRNLDVALQVISIATVNGHRDASWAINTYMKEYNISYRIPTTPSDTSPSDDGQVNVSEEVF